jgi:hypothetical protein
MTNKMFRFLSLLHMRSFLKQGLKWKLDYERRLLMVASVSCPECQIMETRDEVDAFIAMRSAA